MTIQTADYQHTYTEAMAKVPPFARNAPDPIRSNASGAVYEAIANVMKQIGSVAKAGTNEHFNYKFAAAADVTAKLQPLLAAEGLVITQSEVEKSLHGDNALLAVTYEFQVAHKSGQVSHPMRMTGMAGIKTRNGWDDKASNKCHTAARKYFTIGLFQIPTVDAVDADNDGEIPTAATTAAKPVAKPEPVSEPIAVKWSKPKAIVHEHLEAVDWGREFVARVNAAKTPGEIAAWVDLNQQNLADVHGLSARTHALILTRIADAERKFDLTQRKPKISDGDNGVLSDVMIKMNQAENKPALEEIWQSNRTAILSLEPAAKDKAAMSYDLNSARLAA